MHLSSSLNCLFNYFPRLLNTYKALGPISSTEDKIKILACHHWLWSILCFRDRLPMQPSLTLNFYGTARPWPPASPAFVPQVWPSQASPEQHPWLSRWPDSGILAHSSALFFGWIKSFFIYIKNWHINLTVPWHYCCVLILLCVLTQLSEIIPSQTDKYNKISIIQTSYHSEIQRQREWWPVAELGRIDVSIWQTNKYKNVKGYSQNIKIL